MEEAGLKGLLVAGKGHMWTGRGYFRYFTDFHLWGHDALILIPLDDDPVLSITSYGVASYVEDAGWIKDTRASCNLCDPSENIIEAITEKGLSKGKLGIAGFDWILPAGPFHNLKRKLPNNEFIKSDELLDRIRMVKSPLEIKQMYEFWDISKTAMERFVEVLEPGKTGWELAAEACKVMRAGGAGVCEFITLSDGNVRGTPKDVKVKFDDVLRYHMETCGPSGHYSELSVICAFRKKTELENKLMASELKAYDAIMDIAKPGVRLGELAKVFEEVLLEDGWKFGPPLNHNDWHGMGMDVVEKPYWDEKLSTPGGKDDWELPEGTVLCHHPARQVIPEVTKTGICDAFIITSKGGERLSRDWLLDWRPMKI
jgi:Xaa-Pro aminopeptidase